MFDLYQRIPNPGTRVELPCGALGTAGTFGKASGRVMIKLERDGSEVAVKPANLRSV
jgi:hypothetical protein